MHSSCSAGSVLMSDSGGGLRANRAAAERRSSRLKQRSVLCLISGGEGGALKSCGKWIRLDSFVGLAWQRAGRRAPKSPEFSFFSVFKREGI